MNLAESNSENLEISRSFKPRISGFEHNFPVVKKNKLVCGFNPFEKY